MVQENDIIKVWDDGILYLGLVKGFMNSSRSVMQFDILRRITPESVAIGFGEIITSVSNIVMNYGQMSLSKHQEEFPECWI